MSVRWAIDRSTDTNRTGPIRITVEPWAAAVQGSVTNDRGGDTVIMLAVPSSVCACAGLKRTRKKCSRCLALGSSRPLPS